MKTIILIFFLMVLLQSVSAYATVYNYSVTGTGRLYDGQPGTGETNIWGTMQISDSHLPAIYNEWGWENPKCYPAINYDIPYFQLFFTGGQSFTGSGSIAIEHDRVYGGLGGTGTWNLWYMDEPGVRFYHDDGTSYAIKDYDTLASYIELGNVYTGWYAVQNQPVISIFGDDYLTLIRTGVAPVPEPGTIILLGCGLLCAVGFGVIRRKK